MSKTASNEATIQHTVSKEFWHWLQVNTFVESFLDFLKVKKCAETMEFILCINRLENKPDLIHTLAPKLVQQYLQQGALHELNLANHDRTLVIHSFEAWKLSPTSVCATQEFLSSLLHIKSLQLLQLQHEKFPEFRTSSYWEMFLQKLNSSGKQVDFSFRWMIPTKNWTAKHVSIWLQSMQIEEYSLFEEHEIEGEMLCGIDRADLIRMGITKIGSIKRILRLMQDISK